VRPGVRQAGPPKAGGLALTPGPRRRAAAPRAQLPDQAALWGLVQRIIGLGLKVVDLHLVAPE